MRLIAHSQIRHTLVVSKESFQNAEQDCLFLEQGLGQKSSPSQHRPDPASKHVLFIPAVVLEHLCIFKYLNIGSIPTKPWIFISS